MNGWFRSTLVVACILGASGCTNNAILTLKLDLPAQETDGPGFVQIQARSGAMLDFDADWQQLQVGGIRLDPSERTLQNVDLGTSGGPITDPLGVKVRFCFNETCTCVAPNEDCPGLVGDGDAPEVRLEFERAFYQGHYTEFMVSIPTLPSRSMPDFMTVGKCEVAAPECRDGSPTFWCFGGNTHFCEQ